MEPGVPRISHVLEPFFDNYGKTVRQRKEGWSDFHTEVIEILFHTMQIVYHSQNCNFDFDNTVCLKSGSQFNKFRLELFDLILWTGRYVLRHSFPFASVNIQNK